MTCPKCYCPECAAERQRWTAPPQVVPITFPPMPTPNNPGPVVWIKCYSCGASYPLGSTHSCVGGTT